MKLQLAYENELELDSALTHRERIRLIENNILNNTDYIFNESNSHYLDKDDSLDSKMTFEEFYNIRSLTPRTELEERQIRSRWIGVKRVGSPFADETMKFTFDFITDYILYAKDQSRKHEVHVFKMLKKRELKGVKLTEEEEKELGRLEKSVISYRIPDDRDESDVVFYYNTTIERFFKNRLKEESNPTIKAGFEEKIAECSRLRREASKLDKRLIEKDSKVTKLMNKAKKEYELLKKDRNNEELFNSIKEIVHKVRQIKKEISNLEFDLRYLTDDYLQITELQISIE